LSIHELHVLPGVGIEATIDCDLGDRHVVRIGEASSLVGSSDTLKRLCARVRAHSGERILALVIDDRLAGVAAVGETTRAGVHEAFDLLRTLGVTPVLLTGDDTSRAAGFSADAMRARQTPQDKLQYVQTLQAEGHRVLMVGDGVNDAGAPLAVSSGDLVWHGHDLRSIPTAIGHSREALRMIRSNLVLAGLYNSVGIVAASLGLIHPILAAALMTVSSLTVSLRAGRLAQHGRPATAAGPLATSSPASDQLALHACCEGTERLVAGDLSSERVFKGERAFTLIERD
jgi:Cu+-exporting ATPase